MGLGSNLCEVEDFVSEPYKPGVFDFNTVLPTIMHLLNGVNELQYTVWVTSLQFQGLLRK